jgi:hypothetical protein
VPALQLWNDDPPGTGQNDPAGQGIQADWFAWPVNGLYVPARQGVQVVEEVLPDDGLKVPAGQDLHAFKLVLPVNGLYDPAGQEIQAIELLLPLDGLKVPAGHKMHCRLSLETGLKVPVGHSEHLKEVKLMLEPSGHGASQLSMIATSVSVSLRLYTRIDWIAKSDDSPERLLIASLSTS